MYTKEIYKLPILSQYLEYALQGCKSEGKDTDKKNMIREKIKQYFVNRECVPFVRPLGEEKLLARIEEQDWDSLRPEFT